MKYEEHQHSQFPIKCYGRNSRGTFAMNEPVEATLDISRSPNSSSISLNVICKYRSGGHGEK